MRFLQEEQFNIKIGLEIHFQLKGEKLFCSCPTEGNDQVLGNFWRRLRASSGEEFQKDVAASLESIKNKEFHYQVTDNSCLVEFDEEPPHMPNIENINAAIKAALLLNCNIVDAINFMRKIVIDGSNTSGFQRTAIIGIEGFYEHLGKKIGISTVCLEEEASRKIEEKEDRVYYSLDRLGIPLIEVSTQPDIKSPSEAREVAKGIGNLIRRIGNIQRDVDAIRQDLNISVNDGNRVEIKGVQSLSMIETVLQNEIKRQISLIKISNILKERGFTKNECQLEFIDITEDSKGWKSDLLKKGIDKNKRVFIFKLPKMKGLLKNNDFRLGKELADRLKVVGIGGLIHSDELPNYGLTIENINWINEKLNVKNHDAFGLLLLEEEKVSLSKEILERRLIESLDGVPAETRAAQGEETRFMRPLPGGARMYPETDIPIVEITRDMIEYNKLTLPKSVNERISELIAIGVPKQEAEIAVDLGTDQIIERFVNEFSNASVISATVNKLRPKGGEEEKLRIIFSLMKEGKISKEIIEDLYRNPQMLDSVSKSNISNDLLINKIKEIVRSNQNLILENRESSFKKIMGQVMKEMRGKMDGELISRIVKEEIDKILHNI